MLLGASGVPVVAQRWEDFLTYSTMDSVTSSAEEFKRLKKRDKGLSEVFVARMKEILRDTGIEPPLSIEVRVRDKAKVQCEDV